MGTSKYWVSASRICRKRILIWFSVLVAALLPANVAAQIPTGYQDYYVLGYEEHVLNGFRQIRGNTGFSTCICSVVTLVATADEQVVYYDHWEDGYETNLRTPLQSSTDVYTLSAGSILSLESSAASGVGPAINQCVPSAPRNPTQLRYDGRDHIFTSGGPVALAHALWPDGSTYIADAWENYPAQTYAGTYFYYTPVGEDLYTLGGGDAGAYGDMRYVFLQVAAFEKDTTVFIDNGAGQTVSFALNQGDTYYSEGFINSRAAPAIVIQAGTTIRTSKPVQVGVMTGADSGPSASGFQGRFYTLLPEPQWGTDYTVLVPADNISEPHPTEIYIANPNDYPIDVQAFDIGFPNGFTFTIASNQYATATVPYSTKRGSYVPATNEGTASMRLTSPDGLFGVLVAADTSKTNYDWGFSPVPNQYLTNNYYVSWAPGTVDLTANGAPIWVAPIADNTTFYVDYGPCDGIVDRSFTLNSLEQKKIRNLTTYNNTGTHVWATDRFAIAWGESMKAGYSHPYLDLGYTVLPVNADWLEPAATLEKTADPVVLPTDGGDSTFTLVTRAYDVPLTQINISDTLPVSWTYVAGTTTVNGVAGADPTQTGQTLYWGLGRSLAANQSLTLTFTGRIDNTTGITRSVNYAQALTRDAIYGDALNPADDATVYFNDLLLTKSVNQTTVEAGDLLIYTLTYLNQGTEILDTIRIQDVVPVAYVNFQSVANGGAYIPRSSMVRWTIASLDSGESGSVSFRVRVKDFLDDGTVIENRGLIANGASTSFIPSNVVRSVVRAPQMTFLNSGPLVVSQGDLITYTFSYQSIGGMSATGVVVTNTIPALTNYITNSMAIDRGIGWEPLTDLADGDIGRLTVANQLIVAPGAVPSGSSGYIRYVVQVPVSTPPGSDILNAAQLDRNLDIPRTSNMVVTHVSPLLLGKSAAPAVSAPNGLITYTLTYQNLSATLPQTNVIVMDPIPTYTTFVVGSALGGDQVQYSGDNGVTWNVAPPPTVTHIRWIDNTLPTSSAGALNFTVRVQPTLPPSTTIQNTAYISSSELLRFGDVMLDSDPTATPTVDLHILKTAAPTTANAGSGVIAYTLTYSNSGSAVANSVQIFDRIPAGATYVGGSITGIGGNDLTPPYLTWTLGTVPADLINRQAGYQTTLGPSLPAGPLTNTATIRNALMSRSSVATVTVTTRADLQISKSDSPDPVALGGVLTYTLRYTNTGPSDAHDVVIADVLPADVTFGGMVSTPPGVTGPTLLFPLLSWQAANLPAGATQTLVFTVTVDPSAGNQLINTAGISSTSDADPNLGNNTDSETTTVYSPVDLILQKSGSPGTVAPGGTVIYTLAFTNPGPLLIPSAVITDFIPSEVTISGTSSSGATITLVQTVPVYVWNVTNFPAGGHGAITLTATVQTGLSAGHRFTNTAILAAPLETQPADNTDDAVTVISNVAPIALDDSLYVMEAGVATTLAGGFTSVLHNDSDANGDTLTVSPVSGPANGALTLNPDGTFSYTHNGSETASDSFVYQACDTGALCDPATVTIMITTTNDIPIAVGDTMTTTEGGTATTLVGGATSVRANDSDEETPTASLIISLTTGTANGTLNLNSNGTFSYTHNGTETASDSFVYRVCDTGTPAACAQATVTITITPVNDAPVAVDDTATVAEGGAVATLDGGAISVRDNDSDEETPTAALVVTLITGASNGTLTLNPDGTFSYTHNGTETASDSFVYRVCDTGTPAACAQATVTITITPVNDAPIAVDDTATVAEGGAVTTLDGGATSVRANDSDEETPRESLVISLITGPVNGALTLNPDGAFSYTHTGPGTASDSFVYEICDDGTPAVCAQATVTVAITTSVTPPVAADDSATVAEGGTVTTLDGGATSVRDNDSDAETPRESLVIALTTETSHGTLNLNADGTFSYTHDGSETTADSFVYNVCDEGGLCDSGTVEIKITPVNDPPVISTINSLTIAMNGSSGPLPFTISDAETPASALILTVSTSNPALIPVGQIAFGGSSGARTLNLTPLTSAVGTANIVVQVSDGAAVTSMPFAVSVVVRPPSYIYLPMIARSAVAPDLIVSKLTVSANDIIIEIKNIGDAPVPDTRGVWVEGYVNPNPAPTRPNQTWQDLGMEGMNWAVYMDVAGSLVPGNTLTLRLNDAYYSPEIPDGYSHVNWPLEVGTTVYVQVDSLEAASSFGAVTETHELLGEPYNNIVSTQVTAAMYAMPEHPLPKKTTGMANGDYLRTLAGMPPRPPVRLPQQTAPDSGEEQENGANDFAPLRSIYLPLIIRSTYDAPDLIVADIIVSSDNITVAIENIGSAPALQPFWIDAYVDPDVAPTHVNQTWAELGDEGVTWATWSDLLPIAPGEVITLDLKDNHHLSDYSHVEWPLAAGTWLYVQVDSVNAGNALGGITETHELSGGPYNNIASVQLTTTMLMPGTRPPQPQWLAPYSDFWADLPPRPLFRR